MAKSNTKDKATAAPAVAPKAAATAPAVPPVAKSTDDAKAPRAVIVTSAQDGFRRCGRVFGRVAVEIAIDELAAGELERLVADPMLDVVFIADGN